MNYQIEKLSNTNLKDLVFLYKKVFGIVFSENEILKKYDTAYLGIQFFGHLAYYKNKPVAFHGAIPVQMKFNEETELAAQYGDAMTIKSHTGKGLFTKLGTLTDEELKKAGVKFVWGFPNQNSEYGYLNHLKWESYEQIKGYKIKILTIPFEKIFRKTKFSADIYDKIIAKTFSKLMTKRIILGSVFLEEHTVSVDRNKAYYSYKAFTNNFTIEINETLFWIKIKNGLLIGDVEIKSIDKFNLALQNLKQIARNIGINEIVFQTSPKTLIYSLMEEKNDSKFESWKVGYKNFSSKFPLEKLKFTFGDLDTF